MSDKLIKFTRGVPPIESFPTQQLAACSVAVLEKYGEVVLQYGPAGGYPALRSWIANHSGVPDSRVIAGQGSLQLVDILSRVLFARGGLAYVEEPTYDRTVTVLSRAGVRIKGFRLSADGPDMEEVETSLKNGERPVLFYTIPDFQNPSGMVIPLESREKLVDLANEYDFWILEDCPYRSLRYEGEEIPTLFDLAPHRVIRISSFSKLISPGLRVGYAVLPSPLAPQILKYAEDTYINPSYLNQAIVMEFIDRGWYQSHLDNLKKLYAPRLKAMLISLDKEIQNLGKWHKPEGGFFVGLNLNFSVQAEHMLAKAAEAGLQLTDGRGFFVSGDGDSFIRLPFCALKPDEIMEGINRLSIVLKNL